MADTKRLLQLKPFFITVVSLVLIQFAYGVIMPVVPLFLQPLAGHAEIITEAGFIFSLMSLTGALSSALMGGWTERIGVKRMLFWGLLSTAVFLAFQGSAQSVLTFAVLQVMGRIGNGCGASSCQYDYDLCRIRRRSRQGVWHYDQRIGTRLGPGTFYGRIPWIDYGIPQRVFCDGSALFGCGLWDALGYGGVGIASNRARRIGEWDNLSEGEYGLCGGGNDEEHGLGTNGRAQLPRKSATIFSGAFAAGKRQLCHTGFTNSPSPIFFMRSN